MSVSRSWYLKPNKYTDNLFQIEAGDTEPTEGFVSTQKPGQVCITKNRSKRNALLVIWVIVVYRSFEQFLFTRLETGPYYVIGYGGWASTQVSVQ
jgi:hypothetical protein